MKLKNSARFWTGAVMGLFELLALGIYGLTLLSWGWLTTGLIVVVFVILAIVLYNVLAAILILNGSGKDK